MGSCKRPQAFGPLDLEIIDRVYEAAWAQLEVDASQACVRLCALWSSRF